MAHIPAIDWTQLLMLREFQAPGEPDPVADVVGTFLTDSRLRLAALRQAALSGEAGEVALQAHTIKGAAALIGAEALSSGASDVEKAAKANDLQALAPLVERLTVLMAEAHDGLIEGLQTH